MSLLLKFFFQLIFVTMFSALICAGLIVILRPLLRRYALAMPNARSSHAEPTPQGGGIAVLAGTMCAAAFGLWLRHEYDSEAGPVAISLVGPALAAVGLGIVGFIDDVRGLSAWIRLGLQVAATVPLALGHIDESPILPGVPWPLDAILYLVAVVWFVNLVNFMDGIDLMTTAEMVPIAGTLTMLGLAGELAPTATIVAAALLGALLGFAPFNKPKASLFLGDVGSLFIGVLVAWLLLELAAAGHYAAVILLPLYYWTDATLTLLHRIVAGEPVWRAHRDHYYQCAVDRGLPVSNVVARVFFTNVFLSALATGSILWRSTAANVFLLGAGAAAVWQLLRILRGR
jgi:UDP-N-acetylmuramyl pentapeptide phosphotransferase/UDP-N-acetylglucosamine-1-phosphate transferase